MYPVFPSIHQDWLLQALGAVEDSVANAVQKEELMEALFGAKANKTKGGFDRAVARFAHSSFQNQRSWTSS